MGSFALFCHDFSPPRWFFGAKFSSSLRTVIYLGITRFPKKKNGEVVNIIEPNNVVIGGRKSASFQYHHLPNLVENMGFVFRSTGHALAVCSTSDFRLELRENC